MKLRDASKEMLSRKKVQGLKVLGAAQCIANGRTSKLQLKAPEDGRNPKRPDPSRLAETGSRHTNRYALPFETYSKFICDLTQGHTHFLTVTLAGAPEGEPASGCRARLEETLWHFLRRLNRRCFKRRHKKEGRSINCAAVIERGRKLNRLHAHMTLECPKSVSPGEFRAYVLIALKGCRSLGRQYDFKPITDPGGLAWYLSKEGPDGFLPRCSQRA